MNYRKIWFKINGPIPKDQFGRTYEIHHLDGDHKNNSIENLVCLSIQEHYDIHYQNGDYGACVMIAKRMNMEPDAISKIQLGVKRPGIGGVKKGTTPWNKGISGYSLTLSENSRTDKRRLVKERAKISDEISAKIREDCRKKLPIENPDIGRVMKNGKILSYERAFSKEYAKRYGVTEQYLYSIIKGISKVV